MCIDFRERERRKWGQGERGTEREISVREKRLSIAPGCTLDRSLTCNLGICPGWKRTLSFSVNGTMLQPNEPRGQA